MKTVSRVFVLLVGFSLLPFSPAAPSDFSDSDDWQGKTTAASAHAAAWDFFLITGPGLSAPVGSFYDGFEAGGGFGASLRIALNERLAFRAIVRRSNLAEEEVVFIPEEQQLVIFAERTDADIWRVYSALEYYRRLTYSARGRASEMFVYAGIGLANNNLKRSYSQVHEGSDFGAIAGSGVLLMLTESIGIELATSFDLIFTGGRSDLSYVGDDADIAGLWDLTAQLAIALPAN